MTEDICDRCGQDTFNDRVTGKPLFCMECIGEFGATVTVNRYLKPCPYSHIDVYRVLSIFEVTDPCIQHAIKKLLFAGKRGAKDFETDIKEAKSSLIRWEDMRREESGK